LTAYGKDEGLSDSFFSTVFQDREGRIWLGGNLLYWFDGNRFHLFPGVKDTLAIAQARDGDLWFGGYGGLYRWSAGMLSHFKVEAPAVKAIFEDRKGTLWIGGVKEERPGGLYRFRDGSLEQVPGISDVRAITEDRNGGLWLGSAGGLWYMRGSKTVMYDRKQGLSSNTVYDVHQDSTGTLWVATYGGGLNRLRDGRFKAITSKDGLPNNLLLSILEDGKGNLWLSSNQGIFRLSLEELNDFADEKTPSISPVSYGVAEGMRSTESNDGSPAGWKTADGRIWFPTLRGVVAIDPNAGDRLPPPVVLEEAWANKLPLGRDGQTSIPPGNYTFDFRFTALSFSAPEKLCFKYRLDPFDKDWVDARTRRTAHYTNMAPGKYSFEVVAANSYGIWNNQGASVRFVLKPHFYQTLWFRLVLLAGVVLLAGGIHQLRVGQLRARAAQLKQLADTLQEQADLLNLTHDAIFVMDMEEVIKYWNRGAEVQYGWNAEQAVGRDVHELLKTVFPSPVEQIKAEVTRTGRWEGELEHIRRDGTQVVVASRWALQRSAQGTPVAILEINNDITERKRAEESLRRLNRELRAISNCNQSLLRATDEQSLLQEICRIVCEEAGYRMAWVAYGEHDEAKSARPVAWTGTEEGYLTNLGITWADTERGCGPTGTAIRSGKPCCIQDFATDPRLAPWRESALLRDFRSGIALPLKDEHASAFGSLSIYSAQPNAFTPEEIRLLEELAADLAFGIVTLRSQAARERAEQEVALLSFALNNVREAALLIDDTARFHYVNDEACRVLGYTRAELLGKSVPDIDPEFPAGRWSDHWRDLKAQRSLSFESRHRTREGRIFPVEVSANYFEYGGRGYNLALVRDISDRKRAEEALRRSEAYLADAQRLSHTGSWALDVASDKYAYCSEECLRIYGFDPQEGLPTREAVFRRIHPEDRNSVEAIFEKALREKVDSSDELRMVLPDGTVKWVHVIRHPVLNDAGDIVTVIGTSVDITERKRAEESLRLSNAYNRSLIEASVDPLVTIGPDGKITDVNAATEAATGRSRGELAGTDFCDYFTDPAKARAGYKQVFREGTVRDYPLELRHRDGRVMSVLYNASVYRDESGRVIGVFAAARDVTDRKRAEEALRRSEAYLSEAQRLTHTGAWATDAAPEPLYWSEELFRLYGLDPQYGLPTHDQAMQRVHPEDRDKYARAFHRVIHEKVDSDVEFRTVLPDGAIRYLYGLGHPVLNAHGELVEVVGTTVDITERKRAEEALREGETRFRTFVDHAADAFFMLDLEQGIIIDVNRTACASLGYTRQELIGMTPLAFDVNLDRAAFESVAERTAAGETVLFDRHWHRRKDGSLFPVEAQTSVIWHGGRQFLLKVARDISDRLRAEEEHERLHQLEADLAHIHRVSMMGELAASIAHEVNQPLSGVVSNASAGLRWLAADVPNVEEVREGLRRIVRDGKRAAEVIARVRALAKRTATASEKLDLNETIQEVLALVGDDAKRKSVMLRTQFADDLSPVSGDRVQLQQVMLNLVMNAMEAMSSVDERARDLLISTRNIDAEQVQVTVKDSGTGIDPNTLDKIFDPFYTTKPGGMGMGLSISRSILQAHGGRLWAAAKDGPGTIFHFSLPKYHEEESNAAA
jgi:hypothetical protein